MTDHNDTLSPEMRGAIRDEMGYVIDTKLGLGKNGDKNIVYLFRLARDQRVWVAAWIVISAVYQFGGSARALKTEIEQATRAAVAASAKADAASEKADNVAKAIEQTQQKVERVADDVGHQADTIRDVKDGVAMAVKRPEFQSAVQQQILPRLARIEQWMWEGKR